VVVVVVGGGDVREKRKSRSKLSAVAVLVVGRWLTMISQ